MTTIMTSEDEEHLNSVLRHIDGVRKNCVTLGNKLIDNHNIDLGLELIGLGQIHDYSKLKNTLEWKSLRIGKEETPEFHAAHQCHVSSNPHHPEYWHGSHNMPNVFLAEFVCDTLARANEFGTDYREWLKGRASSQYKFSIKGTVYKRIRSFVDLLLDKPFSKK